MRAKEFIIEYNQEATINKMLPAYIQRLESDPSVHKTSSLLDVPPEQLSALFGQHLHNYFEPADPTPQKQYILWLLRMYTSGEIKRLEDVLSAVKPVLAKFHEAKIRKKLPDHMRDINRYKSLTQFYRDVDSISLPEKELTNKGNSEVYYEDGHVRIMYPKDEAAACYYGQQTKWCTAGREHNMFDYYNKQGPMYIILPKHPRHNGEKYQIHFESGQFMNELDDAVSPDDLVDRFPTLTKAFAVESIQTLRGEFMSAKLKTRTKDLLAQEMISAQEDIIVSYDQLDSDSNQSATDEFMSMMDSEELRIRDDLNENDDFMDAIRYEYMQFQKTVRNLFGSAYSDLADTFTNEMKRRLPKVKERLLASI
jgi:hypothetical protein